MKAGPDGLPVFHFVDVASARSIASSHEGGTSEPRIVHRMNAVSARYGWRRPIVVRCGSLPTKAISARLVFPDGEGPEAMAHQLRAERISDETGGRCQLLADRAALPLEPQPLEESPQPG